MRDLIIRKTAVLLGFQIFGVLIVGEILATSLLFTLMGIVTPQELAGSIWPMLAVTVLAKVLLQGYLIVLLAYNWSSNRYIIRGHHLVLRHRLLAQDEKLYELSNLQNIRVHQSWIGRLCNYGSLELWFAMPGQVFTMTLSDVHNPRHYVELFEEFFVPAGGVMQTPQMMNPPTEPNIPMPSISHPPRGT